MVPRPTTIGTRATDKACYHRLKPDKMAAPKRKRKTRIDHELFAQRFKNARLVAGLTQFELAKVMRGIISPKTIPKYESGEIMPRVSAFYYLCQGLDISPAMFFIPFRPEIKRMEFRNPFAFGARKNKSIELQVADAVERFLNMEEKMDIAFDFHNPIKDIKITRLEDVEKAVDILREAWRLGVYALPNVIETLEDKEMRTVEVDVDPRFDGLAGLADGRLPFIVLNKNIDLEDKRFAVLREFGHVALAFPKDLPEKERNRFCEAFARAMLIPKETFLKALGPTRRSYVSLQEMVSIRETYGIGLVDILVRALDLGLIRPKSYKAFRKFMANLEDGVELGAYKRMESPNKVHQLAYRATVEGIISQAVATDYLNVNYRKFQEEIQGF